MNFLKPRFFLLIAVVLLASSLFSLWQADHQAEAPAGKTPTVSSVVKSESEAIPPFSGELKSNDVSNHGGFISVETPTHRYKLSLKGGDMVFSELKKYAEVGNRGVLLDQSSNRWLVAQSGLMGSYGPDSRHTGRAIFRSEQSLYKLGDNVQQLTVPLYWDSGNGVHIQKKYVFYKDSDVADVSYSIQNNSEKEWEGRFYAQMVQNPKTLGTASSGFMSMQSYFGGAVHTQDKPFKKISFDKMKDKPFSQTISGGWLATMERYFVSAWIFPEASIFDYFSRADSEGNVYLGAMGENIVVPAHTSKIVTARLYSGPEEADTLKTLAPGLQLTVDYGIFWPISQALFWTMQKIHHVIGNWGWSIVLVTLLIKLVFYRLSASSYRSMANMRKIQPRLQELKERYKDDKQQFSQAMIDLYRKEKVNPLGGCFPILVQIPVFLALYYVLLENVEFLNAPFILWIQDLSAKDPFYVLPILMGASMFFQQRLSPQPPDPVQAKVMMWMPVFFTVLFLQFPAGLVLYWVVNNVLSILQQWFINKRLGAA